MFAGEVAAILNGRLIGDNLQCLRLSPLYCATSEDLTFLAWPKDISLAKKAPFGALLISADWAADYLSEINGSVIVIENFLEAFVALRALLDKGMFAGEKRIDCKKVSPEAQISLSANIGHACIGAHSVIAPNVVIEDDVKIGARCHIGAGVIIHRGTRIGDEVSIGANTVVGSQAYAPYGFDKTVNFPSLGSVVIEDKVRIGALCSIDRGLIGRTHIRENTAIDNMIHIGHDVMIGKNVLIAAQTALAGFVQVGDDVTLGGQVGVLPHSVIGPGARISGKSLARGKIGAHEIWSGNPSMPHKIYLKDYGERLRRHRDAS